MSDSELEGSKIIASGTVVGAGRAAPRAAAPPPPPGSSSSSYGSGSSSTSSSSESTRRKKKRSRRHRQKKRSSKRSDKLDQLSKEINQSLKTELLEVVKKAIDIGYRHIDTASIYNTEEGVGEAVRQKIANGTVKREDMFITTKLWNNRHKRTEVVEALRESLKTMVMDYVDLYLIHWPVGVNDDYSFNDVDYLDTWRGMEDAYKLGLTKSIGLSNFNKSQVERVLNEGEVKPAALQIEVHPQLVQEDLVTLAQSHGMVVMGYSPFGTVVSRFGQKLPGSLSIDDPILSEIAKKYNKTVPQTILRWLIDRDIVPLPKTLTPKRLEENINVFDFELTKDEIAKINTLNSNYRITLPSFWQDHPYYPFEKIENPIPDVFKKN